MQVHQYWYVYNESLLYYYSLVPRLSNNCKRSLGAKQLRQRSSMFTVPPFPPPSLLPERFLLVSSPSQWSAGGCGSELVRNKGSPLFVGERGNESRQGQRDREKGGHHDKERAERNFIVLSSQYILAIATTERRPSANATCT